MVEKIYVGLNQKGFKVGSLHGDKAQFQRQRTLRAFKENEINILIATDVAARGLDVADITHVINFDKPNNYEDYVHRIGRTGRANAKGFALTFVESAY
jgi:superfamily II DNA/RNA helicase